MELGVPEDTFEDAVAPLVAATVNMIDDALLLVDNNPDEVCGLATPPAFP